MRIDEFFQARIERKSGYFKRAHIENTGVARWSELYERFQRTPRCRISLQWKSHDPSQPAVVPSPRGMARRDRSLRPDTRNSPGTSGNVFDNLPAPIDSASTPYRGMIHPWNPNATFGDPKRLSTERPVARSEEQIGDTTPTSRFARRPSTRKSLFPAEGVYPQNNMVDQRRLLISELHFDKFPTPSTF